MLHGILRGQFPGSLKNELTDGVFRTSAKK